MQGECQYAWQPLDCPLYAESEYSYRVAAYRCSLRAASAKVGECSIRVVVVDVLIHQH